MLLGGRREEVRYRHTDGVVSPQALAGIEAAIRDSFEESIRVPPLPSVDVWIMVELADAESRAVPVEETDSGLLAVVEAGQAQHLVIWTDPDEIPPRGLVRHLRLGDGPPDDPVELVFRVDADFVELDRSSVSVMTGEKDRNDLVLRPATFMVGQEIALRLLVSVSNRTVADFEVVLHLQ
jgi:hypothetical protein